MTRRGLLAALAGMPMVAANDSYAITDVNDSVVALHTRKPIDEILVQRLRALEGVEDVMNLRRYSLMIEKGAAFGWGELRPAILHAAYQWGKGKR